MRQSFWRNSGDWEVRTSVNTFIQQLQIYCAALRLDRCSGAGTSVNGVLLVSGLLPCARHTVANASRAHFGLAMWPSTVYISPQRRPDDSDTTAYPITAQQSNLTTKPDRCRRLTRGGRSPESVVRGLRSAAKCICGITVANADIGCELMLLLLLLLYDFVSSATINQSIIYLYQTSGSYQKRRRKEEK